MTVTLNLDPEKEERLRRKAKEPGKDVADYLVSLADESEEPPAAEYPRTPLPQGSPEWVALLMSMGHGRRGISLSIEATSRESIYYDILLPASASSSKA